MPNDSAQIGQIIFWAIIACWFAFAAVFLFRKRSPKSPEKQRDPAAFLGIFLQGCAYWMVWFRVPGSASYLGPVLLPAPVEIAVGVVAVVLAIGSVWLVMSAVRTLGEQWAVAARLVEGHKLVTDGPYRFVRNPIYTGMLGMLVATGLALGHWTRLAVGIVLFFIGMMIRVRSEEKLLRAAFGTEFDAYAKRVPAVLPGIF